LKNPSYHHSSSIDILSNVDEPVQSGDTVEIIGSTTADGYYTIDSIINDTIFSVIESIPTSTGGVGNFIHPAGALKVGFDDSLATNINADNVQEAIIDLDSAISSIKKAAQ